MKEDVLLTLEYKKPKSWVKYLFYFLGFLLISFIVVFTYLVIKSNQVLKEFSQAAALDKTAVLETISDSLNQFQTNIQSVDTLPEQYNFLVLGTDKLTGRDGDPELTDTILLLQLDFKQGMIKTLSLPRDLYIEDYQTKINALYVYGHDRYPDHPEQFTQEVVEQLSGIKIDYVIVLGIEDLEQLINIVGNIDINVPVAFTDPLFPVQDVDVSEVTDPKLLYEEVSFQAGQQTMTSDLALKYMRSRHSEGAEGTDEARAARQQLVLEALAKRLMSTRDPKIWGQLYRFYLDRFAANISREDLLKILTVYLNYTNKQESLSLSFVQHELSIYPDDENGVIYNPPLWQTKQQWIYQIRDQAKLAESIHEMFN